MESDPGLTAEEARVAAGLSLTTCYWKRCSELRQMIPALTEDTGRERLGAADQRQMVSVITPYGVRLAKQLLKEGFAIFPPSPQAARNSDPATSQKAWSSKPRRVRADRHQALLLLAYYRAWTKANFS